jgi:hypothetical protein
MAAAGEKPMAIDIPQLLAAPDDVCGRTIWSSRRLSPAQRARRPWEQTRSAVPRRILELVQSENSIRLVNASDADGEAGVVAIR